ncbi:MAG: Alkanesulfonate monooxygenase [Hyphomicrobiales bacterium]|nr:Alkanesulfonate monooxygenase [Hyphomicrobiales bacterium]
MTMKFGLYAPIPMAAVGSPEIATAVSQALQPLPPGAKDAQFDLGVDLLQTADRVGFDLALFAERHLGHDMAAWVNASAIASRLDRIRALVAVHPGLWDPVMVAKLAASLDRICKGRMAINIVNGWFDQEFEMFGGKVLQGEDRYRRTIEFIEILRGLWREETFSFEGEHYKVDKGQLLLKPATPTPPDIFSVSTSDRGRDFIAETCDWWFVEFPKTAESTDEVMRSLEASIADMNARTARTGRKVHYALNPFLALGSSAEDALDQTVKKIFAYEADPDTRKIERRMIPATRAGCIGTPADIRRQVQRLEDMGFELLLLKLIPSVENVAAIGAEIIAPLRSGAKAQTMGA